MRINYIEPIPIVLDPLFENDKGFLGRAGGGSESRPSDTDLSLAPKP